MDRRRLLALAVALGAVGLVGGRFLRAAATTAETTRMNACRSLTPNPLPAAVANREAPDFDLPDGSGKTVSLRSFRGRPVVLNFWFTTCPPCIEEVPALEELARRAGATAAVLAVSVDEDWADVQRFFPRGTPLALVHDQAKETAKRFGIEKFPETYFIDASGRARYYFANTRKWNQAEALLCLQSLM